MKTENVSPFGKTVSVREEASFIKMVDEWAISGDNDGVLCRPELRTAFDEHLSAWNPNPYLFTSFGICNFPLEFVNKWNSRWSHIHTHSQHVIPILISQCHSIDALN